MEKKKTRDYIPLAERFIDDIMEAGELRRAARRGRYILNDEELHGALLKSLNKLFDKEEKNFIMFEPVEGKEFVLERIEPKNYAVGFDLTFKSVKDDSYLGRLKIKGTPRRFESDFHYKWDVAGVKEVELKELRRYIYALIAYVNTYY